MAASFSSRLWGGAQRGKETCGCLEVAVIAFYTGLCQPLHGFVVEQAHRGTQIYIGVAAELTVVGADGVEGFAFDCASAGHERKPSDAGALIVGGHVHAHFALHEGIAVDGGVEMGRLGTPFAVLGAAAGTRVDDGAGVKFARAEMSCDFGCRVIQLFSAAVGKIDELQGFVGCQAPT